MLQEGDDFFFEFALDDYFAVFGGTACAAADGPLPIGDIIGIVMAAGGTVWSAYDLYQVKTKLGPEMKSLLLQSVQECQTACRMEALR